jgi:hypothetical protein
LLLYLPEAQSIESVFAGIVRSWLPAVLRIQTRELKVTEESKSGGPTSPEQAVEHARALNEQIIETARKVGQDALQRYVDWLGVVAEEQRKLASLPQVNEMEWFASMLKAQADFTQGFAKMIGNTPFGQQSQD